MKVFGITLLGIFILFSTVTGHEILNKLMEPEAFARTTPEHRSELCNQFLAEPVLAENFIFFDEAESSCIEIVHKRLHYEYYTKNDDEVDAALRCPVIVHDEKTVLYISGFGSHTNRNQEPHPQYFLFQDHPYHPDTITILMRTMVHPHLHKFNRRVSGSRPRPTKLNISNLRVSERYRLTGMDAERAYITWRFEFINYSSSPYVIDQLIKYIEVLKTGSYN